MTPMALTGKQRSHLRGLAHALDPVVQVGKEGVSAAVVAAVSGALAAHELVKVRVLESSPLSRSDCAVALASATSAETVGEIGRIVMLYLRNPDRPRIVVPKAPG